MQEMPAKLKARAARRSAKREGKKHQIALSAIEALKELGYANTSLRDIAEKSDMSLGMLLYYFEDRTDLIIYCVTIYKEQFFADISAALDAAEGRDAVIETVSEALATAILDDAATHRLWYDIRTQAMFDTTFRPVVAEIEDKLTGIVRTAHEKAGSPMPDSVEMSYVLLDSVLRYLMQGQIGKAAIPHDAMLVMLRSLLGRFL